jgi:hypothetical protein
MDKKIIAIVLFFIILNIGGYFFVIKQQNIKKGTDYSNLQVNTPLQASSTPSDKLKDILSFDDKTISSTTSPRLGVSLYYGERFGDSDFMSLHKNLKDTSEVVELIPEVLVVSKIATVDLPSKEHPEYNYTSCCSGTAYWFDQIQQEWHGDKLQSATDNAGKPRPTTVPQSLQKNRKCSIEVTLGDKPYYEVTGGDEQVRTSYRYYLLTDKGYALEFLSFYSLTEQYANSEDEGSPWKRGLQIKNVLSNLKLKDASPVKVGCL